MDLCELLGVIPGRDVPMCKIPKARASLNVPLRQYFYPFKGHVYFLVTCCSSLLLFCAASFHDIYQSRGRLLVDLETQSGYNKLFKCVLW